MFNMGLGMVAVCPEENVSAFREIIPEAFPVGRVLRRNDGEQVILA